MSDSRIGQSVRTPEGHAAISMTRLGPDDHRWIEIQNNTFLNWVNEQVVNGTPLTNFENDFNDGVNLIALVEALQHKPIGRKVFKNPVNQHQRLENVSIALDAIRNDNVKLVNIGSEDIVDGNLKLILGLIWHLILRYQIGKTKFPPKKIMLAWLQSALPKCEISNFSSSWNDGVALHALIEYCSPGTCPDWEKLDKTKKLENCRNAMNIAKDKFDIPLVVRPEDMASHHLDELSGMTYLSYYMKQDSPGYYATLNRVCKMLQRNINNFTTDWNDGQLICELVKAVGGKISNTSGTNEEVLKKGLYAGKELGFKPLMSAKEIASEKEEHLGIMAYAAQFLDKKPMLPGAERITMNAHLKNVHVGNETIIHMNIVDSNVSQENIQVNVTGPDSKPPVHMSWTGQSGIVTFIPTETGQHKLTVLCDGQIISGCPKAFKVNADRSKVSYLQIENCCVGTITEVKVNAVSAGQGSVRVEAKSPSGHVNNLPVMSRNGIYNANFTPSEVGNWKMSVYYDGEHISGSPFDVNVFDPAQVQIYGIDGGTVGKELNFKVDCCHAGKGDLQVKIKYKGRDVPLHIIEETNAIYKVNFTPQGAGLYEIKGLFNDAEIKGSPYTLEIVDSNMVSVSGSGLEQVAVNKLASFHVNTKGAGGGDVKVEIKSPSNQSLPVDISQNDQVHSIQFTPKISGDHIIYIKYNEQNVTGSPYTCKVFDVDKVSVSNMPKTYEAGKYINFDIDASQAGSGNLEIQVNGGRVPCYVKNLGNHKFSASFMPVTQEHQIVQMSFNEIKVKGSPWIIKMVDTSKFTILDECTKYIAVKTLAKCTILGPVSALQNLKINVTAPWDKSSDHKSTVQADEKLQVEFLPEVVGSHKVDISYGGSPLKHSPIIFKVFDANAINLSKIPEVGLIGENTEFTIDTSKCGDGDLKILINNGELQNKVEKISKNTYSVSFVPVKSGPHQIDVTFNNVPVHDSPYTYIVQNTDQIELSQMKKCVPCNSCTDFIIKQPDAKEISVRIMESAPDGQKIPVKVKNSGDKTYLVEWIPNVVGEHEISVMYAAVPVKGSPFNAKAYDTEQVVISSIGQGILGKPVDFYLDASKAGVGNLEIFISVNGENVPNYVKQEPRDACFKVSFIPQQTYKHLIHIKFNGISVPGSPFPCKVLNNEMVQVSGDALQLASANTLSSFKVDAIGPSKDLTVDITSPSGKSVPARINGSSSSNYQVDFTPTEVGMHQISIFYGDVEIKNSPFLCKVFDASLTKVEAPKRLYLNRSSVIEVDTSAAGIGHLDAEIKCQGKMVHSTLREVRPGIYDVTFKPRNTATHLVSLLFNNYPISGYPLDMEVIDSSTISATGEGLWLAQICKESIFDIDTHGNEDNLRVNILCPSGSELPFNCLQRGKFCCIEYTPHEVGIHTIEVLISEGHISGSPFYCNVFDPNSVRIIDMDQSGKIKREITFTVDASAGGKGELEAIVNHRGQIVTAKRLNLGNNLYRFMFTPEETGQYEINIKYNNENIPGCPVVVQVEDDLPTFISINFRGIKHINAMDLNWFLIELDGKKIDMNELQIIIRAPNNALIPTRMIPQYDGDYKIEWTPTIPGCYFIDVHFGGHQIQGSPFTVDVFDINKVNVDALSSSNVGEQAKFVVNYSSAGQAEYAVKIVSPSGQIIPFDGQEKNNKIEITYIPPEPGKYKIYVTYGGIDIPGTPIIQEIGEGGMPTARGDGLYKGEEDKPAIFYVDASELKGDLFVQVDGPNSIAKCNIDPEANGIYTVTYVPVEVGLYDVQVKWNSKEIQGSPFHPKIVNARKVRVVGGWQHFMDSDERVHLVVDEMKKIPFDISEAGPGKLTAEVQDPNNVWLPVHIDTSSDGKNILAFIPKAEGNHLINVYWTEHPLVGAPFLGNAVVKYPTAIHDNSQVTLSGRGLKEAVVREEAEFYIDGSKAGPGKPEVTLTGVHSEIDIIKKHLGNGRYYCTYIPVLPGGYLLHITWNNRQLKGSPYKVSVIAAAQPQKVNVTGEGLEGGILGKELQVNIDTRKAGPGELTAHCMGPTRIAYCELTDNNDGIYKLTIRPQEPGRHILQIKYGGENVLGSPYVLKIGALPDASKVRVSGPGVEHGILATFQSHFLVETDGAGAGKLTVRIRGPKGAFQVHMSRESQRDRKIVCHYDPFETGLYIIQVKWSDINVPGSPFHVQIVDTHQEYEAISQEALSLHNGYTYSESLPHRSSYNQWREDI